MKFENLISHPQDLVGKTIKHVCMNEDELVLTTKDNHFTIIKPAFDEEIDDYIVKIVSPYGVFQALKHDGRIRNFLKRSNVIDFEEFERLSLKEQEDKKKKSAAQKIESEKRLLAELKAKYE